MGLFETQLQGLLQKVVRMGALAESMIQTSVRALTEGNESIAAAVYKQEQQVNTLQVEVDDLAIRLTVLRQPVATNARFLFMASRIGGELERIADQAINICQNTHYVLEPPAIKPLVDLPIMADKAQKMVRDSLAAMVDRDVALAGKVLDEEDQVDAFRDQIFRTLLTYMMGDPRTIQQAMSLILIARNLERIGDHATNIAEEVIYWIQGRDVRHGKAIQPAAGGAADGAAPGEPSPLSEAPS
jgi:phosphate transport system protein